MGQEVDMENGMAFAQRTIQIGKMAKCMTGNLPSLEASCICQATWRILDLMDHWLNRAWQILCSY